MVRLYCVTIFSSIIASLKGTFLCTRKLIHVLLLREGKKRCRSMAKLRPVYSSPRIGYSYSSSSSSRLWKKTENVFKETKKIWAGKFHRFFIFLILKCLTLSQIFSVIQSNRYNRIIDNMRIIGKMNRSTFSGFLVKSDNTTLCVWDFLQYFLANSLACLLIEHYYWSTAAQFGLAPVQSAERDETCSNPGSAGPTLRVLK